MSRVSGFFSLFLSSALRISIDISSAVALTSLL
jgi:hypothetical protein